MSTEVPRPALGPSEQDGPAQPSPAGLSKRGRPPPTHTQHLILQLGEVERPAGPHSSPRCDQFCQPLPSSRSGPPTATTHRGNPSPDHGTYSV